jgi:hypothetical protein
MLDYGGTLIMSEGLNLGGDLEVNDRRIGMKSMQYDVEFRYELNTCDKSEENQRIFYCV